MSETGKPASGSLGRDDMRAQVIWYIGIGGASLCADLLVFTALLSAGTAVFFALVAGFVTGTVVNYMLCRLLAFTGGRFQPWNEVLRLVAVSLVGLGLTMVLVAVLLRLGLSPIMAKLIATVIAFAWNYAGRRWLVFHAEMPLRTWTLSRRAAANLGPAAPEDPGR